MLYMDEAPMKPVVWVGSSRDDLREFPTPVRRLVGLALRTAQAGDKHPDAKPLRGYRGAGVLEVVTDDDGDTYRAVYTIRFAEAVYVLHCFQKKSTRRIATSRRDLDLIDARLRRAQQMRDQFVRRQGRSD
jgi:phage-related protein